MATKSYLTALALILGAGAFALPVLAQTANGAGNGNRPMMGQDLGMMGDGPGMGAMGGPGFDFAGADADADGKVTKDEVAAYRQAMMTGLDADGDGLISVEELATHMKARMNAQIDERAKARIAAQDLDGDGKLSAAELLAPGMPDRMFAHLDSDGDGAISQTELADAKSRMQERLRDGHGMRGGEGRGHDGRGWFGWGNN